MGNAGAGASPAGEVHEAAGRRLMTAGSFAESMTAWERAYGAYVDAGDLRAALRASIALIGISNINGETAAERGWEQRGLRLAAQVGSCVERGYLALCRAGCEYHDPRELQARAELALSVATQFGDRALEMRALGEMGLALVSQGRVDEGFALLDEAMTAVSARELDDPVTCGLTVCAMFSACDRAGDTGRAEYWCRRVDEEVYYGDLVIIGTHCRLVRGVVDLLCGRWETAEERLVEVRARQPLTGFPHQAQAIALLAGLRLSQGRHEEAAELLRGHEDAVESGPVLARLRVDQGRFDEAAALYRAAARGLSNDVMRLAPVLAHMVELELRRGDVTSAEGAAQKLSALDERCESNEIRSLTRLALARIALYKGNERGAIDELETALTLLIHLDRPLLTAHIRLELARALNRVGDAGAVRVEAEAALATFTKLRVTTEIAASREILEALRRRPPVPPGPPLHPAGAVEKLTKREREIAALVAEGLTNREIAQHVFLSIRTVETHVDRALGKLGFRTRTQLATWVQREASVIPQRTIATRAQRSAPTTAG